MSALYVYHYSDTVRLPWILSAGELRSGANAIGGFPAPDFVWATTDKRGSKTAAGGVQGYRDGRCHLVRFILNIEDFEPWSGIGQRHPTWTPDQIARLEQSGRRRGDDPTTWWCRVEPLPLARSVAIETKAYRSPNWIALSERTLVAEADGEGLGVVVNDTVFLSRRGTTERGAVRYTAATFPLRDALGYELVRTKDGLISTPLR